MPLIYQTYYSKHYKAECCSCVSIITLTIYVLTAFGTFLFAYNTNGFWKQQSIGYEQPNIKLKNEFYMEILDSDGLSWQYSTIKAINDKVMNPLSPPYFQIHQDDRNGDELQDFFQVKITFKNDPSKLRKVRLLTVIDYSLRQTQKIKMKSLLSLNVDTPTGASRIVSDGYVVLYQRKTPLIDSITRTIYDKDPLLDLNYEQFDIDSIIDKYQGRNDRADYESTVFLQPLGSAFSTTIEMQINVPKSQEVKYRPGVLETLKFGWVQYVMILLPVLWVVNMCLNFLFKYRVLDAQLVSDLKPKRKIM